MKKVGSRELKNRLGAYLKRVRRGEIIVVTDRGIPVAHLSPVETESTPAPKRTIEDWLKELVGDGHLLHQGAKPFEDFQPVPINGKPLSQMILEDRR